MQRVGSGMPAGVDSDGPRRRLLDDFCGSTLPLAFGCEQLGGYKWGRVDLAEVQTAVRCAKDLGVRVFDTADCYGLGTSERLLGQAIAGCRNDVIIATKFGVRFDASDRVFYDTSPEWCEEALHCSLRRMNLEHVDLYQMHYWDNVTPLNDTFERLERLQDRGLIREYGFCNFQTSAVPTAIAAECASCSWEFSLIKRQNEDIARQAVGVGLCFLPYGVLGQGMLSGRYAGADMFSEGDRRSQPAYANFHGEGLKRSLRLVAVLRECAQLIGVSLPQLAIAWVFHRFGGVLPIVGIKSRRQLSDVVGSCRLRVPGDILSRLDETLPIASPS